jgi:hypothetical protein
MDDQRARKLSLFLDRVAAREVTHAEKTTGAKQTKAFCAISRRSGRRTRGTSARVTECDEEAIEMTISDVEWRLDVGPFQFEIWFDLGAACGLNQRDVWVRERLPIEQTPLNSLPGRVLLDAYSGADREERERAFAADVATVEAEYARAIEEVNSTPPPLPAQGSAMPSSSGAQERRSELKRARRRRKQRRRAIEATRREGLLCLDQTLS